METVLVTGGAGYVGCVLVPLLLKEGYKVRVLDRFRHRSPGLMACCSDPNFEAVRGDCRNPSTIRECLNGVDWVAPLAAVVGAPACDVDPDDATTTNVGAIRTLVREMIVWESGQRRREKECQRIIFPNTNSGYGTTLPGIVCDEESPLAPISHYAMTKCDAEWIVMDRAESVSLRFATAFGASPRMRLDLLVNDFVHRAVRDKFLILYEPHFKRNYIHVRDMAESFLFAVRNWEAMKGGVYNVGLPGAVTKRSLCEMIYKAIPRFRFLVSEIGSDPDKRNYDISVAKMQKLGFHCKISISDGIQELIKVYQMLPGQEFTNL